MLYYSRRRGVGYGDSWRCWSECRSSGDDVLHVMDGWSGMVKQGGASRGSSESVSEPETSSEHGQRCREGGLAVGNYTGRCLYEGSLLNKCRWSFSVRLLDHWSLVNDCSRCGSRSGDDVLDVRYRGSGECVPQTDTRSVGGERSAKGCGAVGD